MPESEITPLLGSSRSFKSINRSNDHSASDAQPRACLCCCWRWHPASLVIVISALSVSEGFLVNLEFFLEYHGLLQWTPTTINLVALLVGQIPQILAALTGALTDWKFSRYAMLYWGVVLQLFGTACMLSTGAVEYFTEGGSKQHAHRGIPNGARRTLMQCLVQVGLVLAGLGTAAVRGSTIALGMDQYKRRGEPTQLAKRFFPVYYWWLNACGGLGMSVVAFVQINVGFFVGYIPVFVAYALCLVLLHCFKNTLHSTEHLSDDGGIVKVGRVYCDAFRAWRERRQSRPEPGNRQPRSLEAKKTPASGFLSYALQDHGGSYLPNDVVDVRNFYNLLLVLIPTLFYNVIMSQTLTSFTMQGNRMSPVVPQDSPPQQDTGNDRVFVPSSAVAAVSCLSIIICIPVFYKCVYPRLERSGTWRITLFRRMGIGMCVAILSVLCAALVEKERRSPERWNSTTHFDPVLFDSNHTASSLSIFWQLPQYILSGVAETLVFISALEFAYAKSPANMKGLCIGLVYTMSGLSGLLSAGVMALLVSYSSTYFYGGDGPGEVHFFYFSLMGVIFVGIVMFAFTTWRYKFVMRTSAVT